MLTKVILLLALCGGTVFQKPAWSDVPLEKQLVYSHKKHLERGYECAVCHTGISESVKAQDRNLPDEKTCRVCHDGAVIRNECSLCHQNMLNIGPIPQSERKFIFSHKQHLKYDPNCRRCHEGITQTDYCKGEYLPKMLVCLECHNGYQASNDCEICHGNVPRQQLRPENHNELWLHAHRSEARQNRAKCSECHTEDTCLDCHLGYNVLANVHDKDYRLKHALDLKIHATDCAACHNTQTFCQDCHDKERVDKPINHLLTADWAVSGHAKAARNQIEACAVCHDGPGSNCITCHKEGGRNPHPANYGLRLGHGPWHDDENYMCYDCHVKQSEKTIGFCGRCHTR